MSEQTEKQIGRDARVDSLGYANWIAKHHAAPLTDAIKARMAERGLDVAEGDTFTAQLVRGDASNIDAARYLDLYERKIITRAQFLCALTVRKEPVRDFLSRLDLAAICTPAGSWSQLRVTPIKRVEIPVPAAAAALAQLIGDQK